MDSLLDVCALIQKGGVYSNVKGSTAEEVYSNLSKLVNLPSNLSPEFVASELAEREKVLSTAVGNGVAIPHPKRPLLENEDDQRIIVCYPEHSVSMHSPDGKDVYVMFVILSHSTKFHLQALSALAKVLKNEAFQHKLETKPEQNVLLAEVKNYSI